MDRNAVGKQARRTTSSKQSRKTATAVSTAIAAPNIPSGDTSSPSTEEIARLAYSYWQARGGHDGSAEDDWFRAEREMTLLATHLQEPPTESNPQLSGSASEKQKSENSNAVTA